MIKKPQTGAAMPKKPAPKKPMAPAPKKKKSYPILSDDGENYNGPKVGPREKTPGGGFSRNGSKLKKAKNGETVERGMTSEVKVRPTFKANVKNDMKRAMSTDSTDYQNTPAKTTAGKVLRGANKVASTVARGVMAPVAAAASVAGNAIKSVSNAMKARKEEKGYKKNGGKVAPKMMMKKMSKKK